MDEHEMARQRQQLQIRAPSLSGFEIPENEKGAFWSLNLNLSSIPGYVDDFAGALALFNSANQVPVWANSWRMLSARQAIVSVYNYSMARKGAVNQLRVCRTISGLANQSLIEKNKTAFIEAFPKLAELRQTVLHQAETLWNEDRGRENRIRKRYTGPFGSVGPGDAISSCLADNLYTASFSGETVTFEISDAKFFTLRALAKQFLSAFPQENT